MKHSFVNRIIILFLLFVAASAQSQSLSQSTLEKYIKSIDMFVNTDNKEIKAIEESFKNNQNFNFDTDSNGNISIMSQMLGQLDSSQMDAISEVAEDAGFDSIKEWASIGDRVSAAMMAIEMEKEPVDMSELTPEMMAMVPESMRQQMEGAIRVMKAIEKVPAADIAIVKANYEELKKHMDGNAN
ncbi:hypothetical protein [Glaciecola petra]|uniref:DUF2059 domain-containing protein n=1 Tax=Glaciecola petra TaxID=3075602 RepID=A0ABU2ZRU8_9ALTE|nr:hypothetical protein [Aestuariibacter sp. P117]MDT0595145.1 hypothetical protein [Aestuariibacter sp. P117]